MRKYSVISSSAIYFPHLLPFDGVNPNSIVILDNASIRHTQTKSG